MARNPHLGSSLAELLREEGTLEEFQAVAIKEVIAWQLDQAIKQRKISRSRLAELMHASGRAVTEDRQLTALLADLAGRPGTR